MTDAEQKDLIGYEKARERFLMESFPKVYGKMQKSGELPKHLKETAEEAVVYENSLTSQMRAQTQNMPFEEKVDALKQIPLVVDEMVMAEIILAPPA